MAVKTSDHSTIDAARGQLTSVVGEVAMARKLVIVEEANGRPDVGS